MKPMVKIDHYPSPDAWEAWCGRLLPLKRWFPEWCSGPGQGKGRRSVRRHSDFRGATGGVAARAGQRHRAVEAATVSADSLR